MCRDDLGHKCRKRARATQESSSRRAAAVSARGSVASILGELPWYAACCRGAHRSRHRAVSPAHLSMSNDREPERLSAINPSPANFVSPSFAEVYGATFHVVWRTARRLGAANSLIDDVVQDVFLTVHRRLPQFLGRCSVEHWVFGILRRVMRNYHRARRRKGAAHATSAVVGDPDELVSDDDPMDTVSLREARQILESLLNKLEHRYARLWTMARLEGMTPLEIAAATGLSVFTVYSRLRIATNRIDRQLSRLKFQKEVRTPRRRSPRAYSLENRLSGFRGCEAFVLGGEGVCFVAGLATGLGAGFATAGGALAAAGGVADCDAGSALMPTGVDIEAAGLTALASAGVATAACSRRGSSSRLRSQSPPSAASARPAKIASAGR
jgi:RNA polymerase sigma-70 factor (ECF subfamily)